MRRPPDHWVEVTPEGYGDIIHPASCPTYVAYKHPTFGEDVRAYGCQVGRFADEFGIDNYLGPSADVAPGWYQLEPWTSFTRGTAAFPSEWNAGLELGRGPFPGPPGTVAYDVARLREAVRDLADRVRGAFPACARRVA